jgi:hypothetical protein
MHFLILILLYDFMQALNSRMKHYTKKEDFFKAYSIYYNLFIVETEIKSQELLWAVNNYEKFCTSYWA